MPDARQRYWVNEFQTRLFYRVSVYWLIYTFTLFNLLFAWRLIQEGVGDLGAQFVATVYDNVPLFLCFVIVAPWIALDAVRFAGRVVGPLHRFRITMKTVAANEPVRLIKLRKDDFLTDVQDDFNAMLSALEQRQAVTVEQPDPAGVKIGS